MPRINVKKREGKMRVSHWKRAFQTTIMPADCRGVFKILKEKKKNLSYWIQIKSTKQSEVKGGISTSLVRTPNALHLEILYVSGESEAADREEGMHRLWMRKERRISRGVDDCAALK